MKENFSEMTKKRAPAISGQKKWGIVGIIFVMIIAICFAVGMGFFEKQKEPLPFTAFKEDTVEKVKTSITLNYIFTSDMKFSVYRVDKEKIINIDIQPSCYTIDIRNKTETVITFKNLVKDEKYIFVKEPYDPKFPEVSIP